MYILTIFDIFCYGKEFGLRLEELNLQGRQKAKDLSYFEDYQRQPTLYRLNVPKTYKSNI